MGLRTHRAVVVAATLTVVLGAGALTGCSRTVTGTASPGDGLTPTSPETGPATTPTPSTTPPGPQDQTATPAPTATPTSSISLSGPGGGVAGGAATELPDGWPAAVPALPGFTITAAVTSTVGGRKAFTATYEATGDRLSAVQDYVDDLKAAGFTSITEIDAGGGSGSIYALKSDAYEVTVLASLEGGKTTVVQSVTEATG